MIKEIKSHDQASKEREHCKREVLHEAAIINCLGDHPNLPFLFGVCTGKEPFPLVLQYYGTGGKSLTLSGIVKARRSKKHSLPRCLKTSLILWTICTAKDIYTMTLSQITL